MDNKVDTLITSFNDYFQSAWNTELVRGKGEPLYRPADRAQNYHQIIFAHGYFSSALHEIAHWCVAGPERRLLEDFGYWYKPDGRNVAEQLEFEKVEVKPQALEWIFSKAAGLRFHVSADNLSGESHDSSTFKVAVWREVMRRLEIGLPERANQVYTLLKEQFQPALVLSPDLFKLEDL